MENNTVAHKYSMPVSFWFGFIGLVVTIAIAVMLPEIRPHISDEMFKKLIYFVGVELISTFACTYLSAKHLF